MCVECGDTGILTHAPEGETIYCEGCARGLTKALRILAAQMGIDAALLDRQRAQDLDVTDMQAIYEGECAEHDRLRGLLLEIRREADFVEMET